MYFKAKKFERIWLILLRFFFCSSRPFLSSRSFPYCVTFKSADRRARRHTKCLFIHDVRDSQGERGLTHISRQPSDLRRWYKRTRRPHYPSAVLCEDLKFWMKNIPLLRLNVSRAISSLREIPILAVKPSNKSKS